MLNIAPSGCPECSPHVQEEPRQAGEDNLTWLARLLPQLPPAEQATSVYLLLVGGTGILDFRLRIAQSHMRDDLTPSYWSHVALLTALPANLADAVLWEIALQPPQGFGFPPPTNGVQQGLLATYQDPRQYPNLALLRIPVEQEPVEAALARFKKQRTTLDAVGLLLEWLSFAWGVGASANPLLAGHGLPSAAMAEVVVGAVGYDVTPGLESRSSCPEAIWQAARWWHCYYAKLQHTPPQGFYFTPHQLLA